MEKQLKKQVLNNLKMDTKISIRDENIIKKSLP